MIDGNPNTPCSSQAWVGYFVIVDDDVTVPKLLEMNESRIQEMYIQGIPTMVPTERMKEYLVQDMLSNPNDSISFISNRFRIKTLSKKKKMFRHLA